MDDKDRKLFMTTVVSQQDKMIILLEDIMVLMKKDYLLRKAEANKNRKVDAVEDIFHG